MTPPPDPPPALAPVLRYYGPWLVAVVVAVAALVAVLDLRSRVTALEAQLSAGPATASPRSVATPPSDLGGAAPEPTPPPPTVVTQGAPPAWSCRGQISPDVLRESIGRY